MKNILKNGLMLILIAFSLNSVAQSSSFFNYQAVVRDNNDLLLSNKQLGIQISILFENPNGNVIYSEKHLPITNSTGLFSISIGGGSATSGIFSNIDWSLGSYFLKVETDLNGGSDYTISATSQLQSVPFALYAQKAQNGFSGEYLDLKNKPTLFDGNYNSLKDKPALSNIAITGSYNDLTNKPRSPWYLGKDTLGGVVFNIYKGEDGLDHGYIACKNIINLNLAIQVSQITLNSENDFDGFANTDSLKTSIPQLYLLAKANGNEWYIPSISEFNLLLNNYIHFYTGSKNSGNSNITSNMVSSLTARFITSTSNSLFKGIWKYQASSSPTTVYNFLLETSSISNHSLILLRKF